MPRKWRAIRLEPAALSLWHGFPTESVFSRKAGTFQLLLDCAQLSERRFKLRQISGEIFRDRNQKPQPILHVLQFCMADEPTPIQVRVCQQYPGECFRQPGFEILLSKCLEDNGRRVSFTRTQVSKARVAKTRELASKSGGVHNVSFAPWLGHR